ncbi:MAG: hypothetical protein COA78_12955, partial [Blastopirellula sp.]
MTGNVWNDFKHKQIYGEMMDYIFPIAMLFIGVAFGGSACWLVMKIKLLHAVDQAKSESNIELSTLKANADHREQANQL